MRPRWVSPIARLACDTARLSEPGVTTVSGQSVFSSSSAGTTRSRSRKSSASSASGLGWIAIDRPSRRSSPRSSSSSYVPKRNSTLST